MGHKICRISIMILSVRFVTCDVLMTAHHA